MNIPDNLEILYFKNGKVNTVYEIDDTGNKCGFVISWTLHGDYREEFNVANGKTHGLCKLVEVADQSVVDYSYFHNGTEITEELVSVVNNISKITDLEKTQIALQTGYVL